MKKFLTTEPVVSAAITRVVLMVIALAALITLDRTGILKIDPLVINGILMTILGMVGFEAATAPATRASVFQPESVSNLISNSLTSNGTSPFSTQVGQFVMELLRRLLPAPLVPIAMPYMIGIIQSFVDKALDTATRGEIQHRVQSLLISLKLIKPKPQVNTTNLLVLLLLMLALAGCAAWFTPLNNTFTADGATLTYTDTGATFDPGKRDALEVVFTLQGDVDTAPFFTYVNERYTFVVDLVPQGFPLELPFTCTQECYLFASFKRDTGSYHEVLPN